VFVDTPGFQTLHNTALNKSLNKTVQGAVGDVDLVLFVVEAGSFTPADARVLALLKSGIPALLIANKLDTVHRRAEIAPWLQSMQQRHPFAEFVPMSAKNAKDIERLFGICEKYLPEQPGPMARTSSPTAASASWPARSFARSCSASLATNCPTPPRS
jgi:GTP-binding protein Era